ncbi:iron(III) transport system permease protein [Gemmobacter caeni]|uniref:Iron(III) transport system permease protein n=1 Tax=Gemmobacter caeni TaxID=589035 RepID=A0A2T6B049_9RHOB|nr:iron ABC transporter permease [Gemmobacter caeni]PTX49446.1 iron(III) transport system permease protein [Gemmobacter caeni]TWJ00258.1 iron(III) transport system permease protein [Gemmobacter caeni]
MSMPELAAPGWRRFLTARRLAPLLMILIVGVLVLAPLLRILLATLSPAGIEAWGAILASPMSPNLWWRPLMNTLILGLGVSAGCLLLGGFTAWLVVMTDVPGRRILGVLHTLPFMIPSFAAALAWGTLFRNGRMGGSPGFFEANGFIIPDWLAWGIVPVLIVLIAHYYSLAFTIIAAALSSVGADLVEAAQMTGARRPRIFFGIVLPVVTPALVSAASLTLAGAVANFAAPALLGLPVRMQTLSTRLFGMIEIGQAERGFVLALLLIAVSGIFLFLSDRLVSGRRAFVTVTGKGGRTRRFPLGKWRWPLFVAGFGLAMLTTIVPVVVLVASSLATQTGALFSNWTLHFWLGEGGGQIAQGTAGIFRNPVLIGALLNTLKLGVVVALITMLLGLALAHTITRNKGTVLANILSQLAFLPLLIPSIAFAAAYIALFGAPIGPLPSLYGSFTLLVMAAAAHNLPYAVQSGRSVLGQISTDLEESARLTGAGPLRRMWAIVVPLAIRGLLAGAILVFVKMVRDLSLVVLLFSATSPVLSMVAYRYAAEGFMQFANAITVLILVICLTASLVAQALQARVQKWKE